MKKFLLFLLPLLLVGCTRAKSEPACRVVTEIRVEFSQNGDVLTRSYTSTESIRSVLTYLRILKPFGPVVPDGSAENGCRITLHYSSGPDSVILQQGSEYLCRDGGEWETIDGSHAALLYPLLLLLPSDQPSPTTIS